MLLEHFCHMIRTNGLINPTFMTHPEPLLVRGGLCTCSCLTGHFIFFHFSTRHHFSASPDFIFYLTTSVLMYSMLELLFPISESPSVFSQVKALKVMLEDTIFLHYSYTLLCLHIFEGKSSLGYQGFFFFANLVVNFSAICCKS